MDWNSLLTSRVIEYRRGHTRITPQFLAHAEGTLGRMNLLNPGAPLPEVLHMALYTWTDKQIHAGELLEYMQDRNQMGLLQSSIAA